MTASPRSFRNHARALGASAAAAVLVFGVAGPVQSEEPISGTGTSSVSVVPVDLTLDGLGVPLSSTLGSLSLEATNVERALAAVRLGSIGAAGHTAPGFEVSSADGDRSGDERREASAAGVGAALGLVDYAVTSADDRATARLAALAAELTTPLGLDPTVDAQQVIATATPTSTNAGLDLSLGQLELGLGDLLPPELLDALPLSVVIDLANRLGMPLPADVAYRLADLDALPGTLQDAVDAAGDVAEVESLIADIIASNPDLAAAQELVDAAIADVADATTALEEAKALVEDLEAQAAGLEAEITAIEAEIASLEESLLGLDPVLDALLILAIKEEIAALTAELEQLEEQAAAVEADLVEARAAVVDAETALAAAEAALASAEASLASLLEDVAALDPELAELLDQLTQLEDVLGGLLDELADLLDGLDLPDLRLDLLDTLLDTPLLDLGGLAIDLAAVADGTGSTGTASCAATGLSVLGAAVSSPDCAGIAAAIDQVDAAISDALSALPLASALPGVVVSGLDVTSSGASAPVDGVSSAFARISALTLDVSSVDLTGIVDGVLAELDRLVEELNGTLGEIGIVDLDQVTAADIEAAAIAVPLDLEGALADLQASLDLLPIGDALAGLSTVGLAGVLGAVGVDSTFTAAGAGSPATPNTPGAPGTPETPGAAPGSPTAPLVPGTSLPRTGDSLQLLAAAALAALAAGGVTLMLGRSVALGVHRAPVRRPPMR